MKQKHYNLHYYGNVILSNVRVEQLEIRNTSNSVQPIKNIILYTINFMAIFNMKFLAVIKVKINI